MMDNQRAISKNMAASGDRPGPSLLTITLPKDGGSVRWIGEKVASNPVTGTGSSVLGKSDPPVLSKTDPVGMILRAGTGPT
jgi:hypothetical protein